MNIDKPADSRTTEDSSTSRASSLRNWAGTFRLPSHGLGRGPGLFTAFRGTEARRSGPPVPAGGRWPHSRPRDRRKIEKQVTKSAYEHLIIFIDEAKTTQIWQWVARQPGQPAQYREHHYHPGHQSGDALIQKLSHIYIPLDEEEALDLTGATHRLRDAFDRDQVTKKFYDRFKAEHAAFLAFIKGITDQSDKELFCFSWKWRNATSELYYNSGGVSPMRKPRKNYMPPEKVAILRRHLIDRVPVSDLCDEYQLSPTIFYAWQKLFFENGAQAFVRKNGSADQSHLRTIAALREKLQRKNEVVAELMEEHIQLKKEIGEL